MNKFCSAEEMHKITLTICPKYDAVDYTIPISAALAYFNMLSSSNLNPQLLNVIQNLTLSFEPRSEVWTP